MDLKDFVASSLTQIVEGIREAQTKVAALGAWISPVGSAIPDQPDARKIGTSEELAYLHNVQFDVAITVSDEQKAGAGAAIQIFGAKIGADGAVTYQNAAVSRIQFVIPVVWPGDLRPDFEKKMQQQRAQSNARDVAATTDVHIS